MQNQMCRVCDEPAAGFHFGAFTCEGCKSFFGRTCNNTSVIQECKNNYRCVVDKKNRTACKACRLRKCLMVGMSKSGSRYGRRSNWFKIHCLMQQSMNKGKGATEGPIRGHAPPSMTGPPPISTDVSPLSTSSLSPTSPPRSWHKEPLRLDSPKAELPDRKSPDLTHSPTLLPRATSFGSAPSPFASVLPQPPPASPPSLKSPDAQSLASLSPLYGGFAPTFPLMSTPGFQQLPIHKQMFLSPLLAHTHFWQMARANPLLASAATAAAPRPELDLMAEHKALMERFAAAAMAAQTAAAASAASTVAPPTAPSPVKEFVEKSTPPASPKTPVSRAATESTPPQNMPIDLSKKSSDEDSSADEDMDIELLSKKRLIRSDLNRNVLFSKPTSSGSDADEEEDEELDVGENLSR